MKRFMAPCAIAISLAGAAQGALVYGLSTRNQLVTFDSATPGTLTSSLFITGMQGGEEIIGIDIGAGGALFALGSFNRLYTINPANAAASPVGAGFLPQLNGVEFGFDADPAGPTVRVTSDLGQFTSINSGTGAGTAGPALAFGAGDPNAGTQARVTGLAHGVGGAGPFLWGIDSGVDALVGVNTATGALTTIGGLGFNTSGLVGFDFFGPNTGLASLTAPGEALSRLFSINLGDGQATAIGAGIGIGTDPLLIRDITVVPGPASLVLFGIGGLLFMSRRRSAADGKRRMA
jgi:hypothetical protein